MSTHKLDSRDVLEVYQNKQSWSQILWTSLFKSVLSVVAFTATTAYFFEGFWVWIAIGCVLLFALPLYNLLELQKQKNDFDKLARLTGNLPDELGDLFLKEMLQSVLDEEKVGNTFLPLNKKNKIAIIDSLKTAGVIPSPIKPRIKETYDVIELLRKYADNHIFKFDSECIVEKESYTQLVAEHLSITRNQVNITDLSSFFDFDNEQVTITFKYNGQSIRWAFEQSSNWISDEFFENIFSFVSDNSEGEFLMFPPEDQCTEVIFLPKTTAELIKQCGILKEI